MSDKSTAAKIDALMHLTERFDPPAVVTDKAQVKDPKAHAAAANADPDGYWAAHAETMTWTRKWSKVCTYEMPNHQWFIGGKTNITLNCYDRHIDAGLGDRPALTFESEHGEVQTYTYAQALAKVSRIANGLKSLGVGKGDRVVIYMPLTPEGIFTMQACARIARCIPWSMPAWAKAH